RGDDEKQRDRQRRSRSEEGGQRGRRPPSDHREQHENRKRENAQIQVELGEVIEKEAGDRLGVVGTVADDGVGAEQITRRSTAQQLRRDHEDRAADQQLVEHAEAHQRRAQGPPPEQREQKRRDDDRRREGDGLHASREEEPEQREQRQLASPRRTFEHQDE